MSDYYVFIEHFMGETSIGYPVKWTVAGPFTGYLAAEQAATAALGSARIGSVYILSGEQFEAQWRSDYHEVPELRHIPDSAIKLYFKRKTAEKRKQAQQRKKAQQLKKAAIQNQE